MLARTFDPFEANKTGLDFKIFHFNIRGMLYVIGLDK